MAELRPIIVFHGRHFVRHLEICIPISVKLLQVMSGVIPSILNRKQRLYVKPFPEVYKRSIHTQADRQDRHTHTQTTIA